MSTRGLSLANVLATGSTRSSRNSNANYRELPKEETGEKEEPQPVKRGPGRPKIGETVNNTHKKHLAKKKKEEQKDGDFKMNSYFHTKWCDETNKERRGVGRPKGVTDGSKRKARKRANSPSSFNTPPQRKPDNNIQQVSPASSPQPPVSPPNNDRLPSPPPANQPVPQTHVAPTLAKLTPQTPSPLTNHGLTQTPVIASAPSAPISQTRPNISHQVPVTPTGNGSNRPPATAAPSTPRPLQQLAAMSSPHAPSVLLNTGLQSPPAPAIPMTLANQDTQQDASSSHSSDWMFDNEPPSPPPPAAIATSSLIAQQSSPMSSPQDTMKSFNDRSPSSPNVQIMPPQATTSPLQAAAVVSHTSMNSISDAMEESPGNRMTPRDYNSPDSPPPPRSLYQTPPTQSTPPRTTSPSTRTTSRSLSPAHRVGAPSSRTSSPSTRSPSPTSQARSPSSGTSSPPTRTSSPMSRSPSPASRVLEVQRKRFGSLEFWEFTKTISVERSTIDAIRINVVREVLRTTYIFFKRDKSGNSVGWIISEMLQHGYITELPARFQLEDDKQDCSSICFQNLINEEVTDKENRTRNVVIDISKTHGNHIKRSCLPNCSVSIAFGKEVVLFVRGLITQESPVELTLPFYKDYKLSTVPLRCAEHHQTPDMCPMEIERRRCQFTMEKEIQEEDYQPPARAAVSNAPLQAPVNNGLAIQTPPTQSTPPRTSTQSPTSSSTSPTSRARAPSSRTSSPSTPTSSSSSRSSSSSTGTSSSSSRSPSPTSRRSSPSNRTASSSSRYPLLTSQDSAPSSRLSAQQVYRNTCSEGFKQFREYMERFKNLDHWTTDDFQKLSFSQPHRVIRDENGKPIGVRICGIDEGGLIKQISGAHFLMRSENVDYASENFQKLLSYRFDDIYTRRTHIVIDATESDISLIRRSCEPNCTVIVCVEGTLYSRSPPKNISMFLTGLLSSEHPVEMTLRFNDNFKLSVSPLHCAKHEKTPDECPKEIARKEFQHKLRLNRRRSLRHKQMVTRDLSPSSSRSSSPSSQEGESNTFGDQNQMELGGRRVVENNQHDMPARNWPAPRSPSPAARSDYGRRRQHRFDSGGNQSTSPSPLSFGQSGHSNRDRRWDTYRASPVRNRSRAPRERSRSPYAPHQSRRTHRQNTNWQHDMPARNRPTTRSPSPSVGSDNGRRRQHRFDAGGNQSTSSLSFGQHGHLDRERRRDTYRASPARNRSRSRSPRAPRQLSHHGRRQHDNWQGRRWRRYTPRVPYQNEHDDRGSGQDSYRRNFDERPSTSGAPRRVTFARSPPRRYHHQGNF